MLLKKPLKDRLVHLQHQLASAQDMAQHMVQQQLFEAIFAV